MYIFTQIYEKLHYISWLEWNINPHRLRSQRQFKLGLKAGRIRFNNDVKKWRRTSKENGAYSILQAFYCKCIRFHLYFYYGYVTAMSADKRF